MKRHFKSFTIIINYKALLVTGMAIISTYVCHTYGLTAKFPETLVGVAIVFPVVFSIGSAYARRETALQRYSDFRGHAIAAFYATRDWTADKNNDLAERMRMVIRDLLIDMKSALKSHKRRQGKESESRVYQNFSRLSALTMEMRNYGVQSGEISRISQYVSKMIIAFDNMKMIHDYRTPITLRSYSKVFIYVFPIIYGPYFASTFKEFESHLEYVMPILYSFILVSLDNIQDHLENPFDEVGEDDISINASDTTDLMK